MHSIDHLRGQVEQLKTAAKEHQRSAFIRALQRQLQEREGVVDVLKQFIAQTTKLSPDEVRRATLLVALVAQRARARGRPPRSTFLCRARSSPRSSCRSTTWC